jgi:SAM-dependent methyltransferase
VSLAESLSEHERAWNERPLLRRIYREWFALLASRVSGVDGATVELGSGIGQLREFVPDLVTTDVEETPWADRVVDAGALPYADGTLANIVMLDVFHHLPRPAVFLDEARRTLAPGGRVVMLEPYVSRLSALAYRLHHERLELDADGLAESESTDPLDANLAQTTLAFFRQRSEYERRWPELPLVDEQLLSLVVYPLSGGFTRRPLLPQPLYRPLAALERALSPLLPLAAFRCLVVLERR